MATNYPFPIPQTTSWLWFAKYSTSNGAQQWFSTYTAAGQVNAGLGITRDSENRIYVTGIEDSDLFIGVYQDAGTQATIISTQTISLVTATDGAWDIKVDTSLYIYLTGTNNNEADIIVGKYGFKPYPPSNLTQYDPNGSTIPWGSWTNYQTVRTSFTLSDYNPTDTLQFRIQFSTDSNFSYSYLDSTLPASATLVPGTTNYLATLLAEGTWYWRVQAIDNRNGIGNYAYGNGASYAFGIDTTPPSGVGFSFLNVQSANSIISSGTATDNLSGLASPAYTISRSSENFTWPSDLEVGWVSSHTWTNLIPNTTYWFRIKARDNVGNQSVWSSTTSVVIVCEPANNLQWGPVYFTSMTVSWAGTTDANPSSMTYIAQVSTISNYSGTIYSSTSIKLAGSAIVSGLSANTTYWGRVISEYSGTVRSTTNITASTATLADVASGIDWGTVFISSITVNWTTPDNNPANTVYLAQISSDNFLSITAASQTVRSAGQSILTGLQANTTYYARIISRNWQNQDTVAIFSTSKVSLCNLPVSAVLQALSTTTLQLSWGTNENPANPSGTVYLAEISTAGNLTGTVHSSQTIKTNLSATFINLSTNTIYYGRLTARNWENVDSLVSVSSRATYAALPTSLKVHG